MVTNEFFNGPDVIAYVGGHRRGSVCQPRAGRQASLDGEAAIVAAKVVNALREVRRRFMEQRVLGERIHLPGFPRVEVPVRCIVAFDVSDIDVLGDAGSLKGHAKLLFEAKDKSNVDTYHSAFAANFMHDGIHHSGRRNSPRLTGKTPARSGAGSGSATPTP